MKNIICSFLTLLLLFGKNAAGSKDVERKISIMNESGHRVEIHWIHPQTQELVLQSTPHVFNGASFDLNSFIGHTFQATELPKKKTNQCSDSQCKVAYFTVNENDNQVFFLMSGMKLVEQDNKSIARDKAHNLLDDCRRQALSQISYSEDAADTINDLVDCVESGIAGQLEKANEEIAFQAKIRTQMGGLLENYTCADESLNTTEPIETKTWYKNRQNVKVNIMQDRVHSKIHVLENFINEDECKAVEDSARIRLHQATVADGDGGSRISENRKAMQAGISVPWHRETFGNPIAVLSRRVFDYTNSVTDFGLEEFGQEDLMSIQYTGRGEDDEAPDRYMPHCDGECGGLKWKTGTRVATMVMYCEAPEKGGATNFRNSGIHVKAKKGNAVFFSYLGDDGYTDTGFTEHSGCPVTHGEKKIVTQWMRKGVDKKNPWDSFNTLGVKISESD